MSNLNKYYISYNNAIYGPYSFEELENHINQDTVICREGDDNWSYAKDLEELKPLLNKFSETEKESIPSIVLYYALIDEKEYGPYSIEQLKEFINKNHLIRRIEVENPDAEKNLATEEKKDWKSAETFDELKDFFSLQKNTGIKDWFYFDENGTELGPFSKTELDGFIIKNTITENTYIKHLNWKDPVVFSETKLYKKKQSREESDITGNKKETENEIAASPKKLKAAYISFVLILTAAAVFFGYKYFIKKYDLKKAPVSGEPANPVVIVDKSVSVQTDSGETHDLENEKIVLGIQSRIPEIFGYNPESDFFQKGKLYVIFVDVGQGDGIIILTPSRKCYVVDAGLRGAEMIFYLKKLGIEQIEALIMTHPHNDHIGGIPNLLYNFKIKLCYDCGMPHSAKIYKKILDMISEKKIKYEILKAGKTLNWDKNVKIEIFHPDGSNYDNINNYSIVFKLTYGSTSFLLTGDAENEAREKIMKKYKSRLKANVLKAGHHGSHNGIDEIFLKAVKPKHCVISCGLNNHFGHPHKDALILLEKNKVNILRTDMSGNIFFESDGKKEKYATRILNYDTVNFEFKTNPLYFTDFSDLNIAGNIWKIYGKKDSMEFSKKGLTITAEPMEQIYNYSNKTPILLKKRALENTLSLIKMKGSKFKNTDGAILVYYDLKNWISLSCSEGNDISLTNSIKGNQTVEYFKLFEVPEYYAVEINGNNINIAVSEDKINWYVLRRYSGKELGFKPSSSRIGLSSNSWNYDNVSKSVFYNYCEYAEK